jgi:hypothetical protein
MPAVIPLLVPILTAAAAATTIGTQVYSLENQPGTPKAPSTTPIPLTAAQNQNQAAAVTQGQPNLTSQVGGSVSPEYRAQWGALDTGVANDPQAAGNIIAGINQYLGLAAPGNTGLSTSGPSGGSGIMELLSKAKLPGAGGGGEGGGSFVDSILSGDSFKGLAG